ncbi:MAG: isochorismate synthase, partial [Natrialbaceae archaeon]
EAPWNGFEVAAFTVPAVQVSHTDEGTWITATDSDEVATRETLERWTEAIANVDAPPGHETPPAVESTTRSTDREAWTSQVLDALDRIERGDLEKVVLAQALTTDLSRPVDVTSTLSRLASRYPGCYRFAFDRADGGTFFGATPERLVAKRDTALSTEALAGSVPRGETAAEDEDYLTEMVESGKAQREHGFVVDSIRDNLRPHAIDVRVGDQTVRRLATIQHLRTPIEADLGPDRHVLDVVGALHPTPAVGGAPQEAACEAIRSIETFDRGWYAGPIGWFDADGDGEFAVGIRSAVARGSTVTSFGGNGIVADSDPDEEWAEVQLKLEAIRDDLR